MGGGGGAVVPGHRLGGGISSMALMKSSIVNLWNEPGKMSLRSSAAFMTSFHYLAAFKRE